MLSTYPSNEIDIVFKRKLSLFSPMKSKRGVSGITGGGFLPFSVISGGALSANSPSSGPSSSSSTSTPLTTAATPFSFFTSSEAAPPPLVLERGASER